MHGLELDAVPTRAEFFENPYGWNPYWTIYEGDWNRGMEDMSLRRDCPPDAPGALYPVFTD